MASLHGLPGPLVARQQDYFCLVQHFIFEFFTYVFYLMFLFKSQISQIRKTAIKQLNDTTLSFYFFMEHIICINKECVELLSITAYRESHWLIDGNLNILVLFVALLCEHKFQ